MVLAAKVAVFAVTAFVTRLAGAVSAFFLAGPAESFRQVPRAGLAGKRFRDGERERCGPVRAGRVGHRHRAGGGAGVRGRADDDPVRLYRQPGWRLSGPGVRCRAACGGQLRGEEVADSIPCELATEGTDTTAAEDACPAPR